MEAMQEFYIRISSSPFDPRHHSFIYALTHWNSEQPAVALDSGLAMPPTAPLLTEDR